MAYWISIPIVILIGLLIFRVFVRRDYLRKGSLSVFSTFLEFLIFGLHANLPYLYLETPWPQFPPLPASTFLRVTGFTLLIVGLLAVLGIMAYLGFKTTVGDQPQQLRQTGPYAWSRNPQLITYSVVMLGFAILYPSWQAAAWMALYAVIAHIMVLTEEEHLEKVFGAEYQKYCHQVPRYFGLAPTTGNPPEGSKE
jgi:protein-S-isoprenylcysteine O-methyltransferase Ste14